MLVRVISQFSSRWEIPIILLVFLLLPRIRISLYSYSWKGLVWFWRERSLKSKISRISILVRTLFLSLLSINFRGLIPFAFARRRQGWFRILFSISLFIVRLSIFFSRGKISFLTHLVPTGAPVGLGLVLFWIEIISTLIRPLTLVLRLCANMTAGHVILGLISSFFVQSLFIPRTITLILFLCGIVFFLFERFVAFIQRLVFSLLLIRYLEEAM